MTWDGDLRNQILHDFRESARLKGAKTPENRTEEAIGERPPDLRKAKRRIVTVGENGRLS